MTVAGANLQVRDLRLRFPGQSSDLFAISELNLEAGASLGICGPSGAGKTTLFQCLSGMRRPSHGQILWGGTDLCALAPAARDAWRRQHLGLIFQDFHLVDGLSAIDNVLLPASFSCWRPSPELRQRGHDLLHALGFEASGRRVECLSRGERQRVAFARAMLYRPAFIMADEPTASLDPDHRHQLGDVLLELIRAERSSLIVISHEPGLLARMDRCLRLENGVLSPDDAV